MGQKQRLKSQAELYPRKGFKQGQPGINKIFLKLSCPVKGKTFSVETYHRITRKNIENVHEALYDDGK